MAVFAIGIRGQAEIGDSRLGTQGFDGRTGPGDRTSCRRRERPRSRDIGATKRSCQRMVQGVLNAIDATMLRPGELFQQRLQSLPRRPAVAAHSAGRCDPKARSCSVASAAATPTIPKPCRLQSGEAYASGVSRGAHGEAGGVASAPATYALQPDRSTEKAWTHRRWGGVGSGLMSRPPLHAGGRFRRHHTGRAQPDPRVAAIFWRNALDFAPTTARSSAFPKSPGPCCGPMRPRPARVVASVAGGAVQAERLSNRPCAASSKAPSARSSRRPIACAGAACFPEAAAGDTLLLAGENWSRHDFAVLRRSPSSDQDCGSPRYLQDMIPHVHPQFFESPALHRAVSFLCRFPRRRRRSRLRDLGLHAATIS